MTARTKSIDLEQQQASTKQEILQCLLKSGESTAQDLANILSISAQAVRRHLKDLESEGAILYRSVALGNGRPQHLYQLSQQGRDKFPNQYDRFAISFLNTLVENLGYDSASEILQKHWEKKSLDYRTKLGCGSLKERMAKLVELRRQEGYMSEYHPIGEPQQSFVLTEHNCAIAHVAESFPAVCGHELEMFGAVLTDCQIERTHWLVDGEHRCGYLISAR
jgi:DeoR family transcriptional regulator, suf operon transcriptional repressor